MPIKTPAPYFQSYAQRDTKLCESLHESLADCLAGSRTFDYKHWRDRDVLIGERWDQKILAELERHRLVLLMITPTFFSRPYILDKELPRILIPGKIVLPVLLKEIDLSLIDARGIDALQIFAIRVNEKRRAYSQCNPAQRERFVLDLFRAIEARLARDLRP